MSTFNRKLAKWISSPTGEFIFSPNAAALLAGGLIAWFAGKFPSELKGLLEGVAASLASFSLIGYARDYVSLRSERKFQRFFGKETVKTGVSLVFPEFCLDEEVSRIVEDKGINPQLLYSKPDSPFSEVSVHRIDIPRCAAVNDLRALSYVASMLGSYIGTFPVIEVDHEAVRDCPRTMISFGLSSNDCTHLYLKQVSKPLISLPEDGFGSEYLRVLQPDGRWKDFRSTQEYNYGIILRCTPNGEDHPERKHFMCAGLGPDGTSGAAWYLAYHWRKLASKVDDDDFVAVVEVPCRLDAKTKLKDIVKSSAIVVAEKSNGNKYEED